MVNHNIDYDNEEFDGALKQFWPTFNGRNLCTIDSNGHPLGGFGFMNLSNNVISCFVLKLKPGWASRKLYSECLKFPFTQMKGMDIRVTIAKNNIAAQNICKKLGGVKIPTLPFAYV